MPVRGFSNRPAVPPVRDELAEPLTPRESEILQMLASGLANKEIASRLNISEHTVKFHVASILGKFGAGSRRRGRFHRYSPRLSLALTTGSFWEVKPASRQLFFQFNDSNRVATAISGFGANRFDQRMRPQKLGEAAAERACAVAVDQAHLGRTCERCLIEKFIDAARGFFDRASDEVNFFAGGFG